MAGRPPYPWPAFPPPPPPEPPSKKPMSTLGVLAIAVGVAALGMYALDWHAHHCEACGHKWRHLGAFNLGDPRAHSCSKCGTVQWWKDGVPHVFRESLRSTPVDPIVKRMQQLRDGCREDLSSETLAAWPVMKGDHK